MPKTAASRVILLDMDRLLGGLPDGSIQVTAGGKCSGTNTRPATIQLDMAKVLGGLPDGSLQVTAGTKLPGTKALGLKLAR